MSDSQAALDRLALAIDALHAAAQAVLALARAAERAAVAPTTGDDEWTRMPARGKRCPISSWSRSKIEKLIQQKDVRKKTIRGSAFYAGADVRRLIAEG